MRTDETGSVGERSRIIPFALEGDVEGVMQAEREEASDRMLGFLGTSFAVDPLVFLLRDLCFVFAVDPLFSLPWAVRFVFPLAYRIAFPLANRIVFPLAFRFVILLA